MKNTHSYPTEADRALAESARGDWARLSNQSIPLAAVVEVVRVLYSFVVLPRLPTSSRPLPR